MDEPSETGEKARATAAICVDWAFKEAKMQRERAEKAEARVKEVEAAILGLKDATVVEPPGANEPGGWERDFRLADICHQEGWNAAGFFLRAILGLDGEKQDG